MKSRKGTSWATFNRVINEGPESLRNWISNSNSEVVANHILKLSDNKKSKTVASRSSNIVDIIKHKKLNVDVINSVAREYPTRSKCWTFNCLELCKFDYILLIGYDMSKTTYWLIKSSDMDLYGPPKKDTQTINGRVGFSLGISESKKSSSWMKYEKYILAEGDLIKALNNI